MTKSMTKTQIKTDAAPQAIGPYSQAIAVECSKMLFVSGQIPLNPATQELEGETASEQARLVLSNLKGAIEAGGADLSQVVKTTIFVKSMDDFAAVNQVYGEFFTAPYPARATVEVSRLPKDVLVEIDAVAAF
jgi:2-iminobutanoate/2-iminopropanoate deaminase